MPQIARLIPEIPGVQTYSSGFDNIYPWSAIQRCVTDATTGAILYFLHPLNSSFKEDGITMANILGPTADGDTMVYIPAFYYSVVHNGDGTTDRKIDSQNIPNAAGTNNLPGYKIHPAFLRANGTIRPYVLVGAFLGTVLNSTLRSIGQMAITSNAAGTPVTVSRTAARNTRTGTNFNIMNYQVWQAVCLLFTIENGTHIGSNFGLQVQSIASNYITGNSIGLGVKSGKYSSSSSSSWYRGFEWIIGIDAGPNGQTSYIGQMSEFIEGVYTKDNSIYTTHDPGMYGTYAWYIQYNTMYPLATSNGAFAVVNSPTGLDRSSGYQDYSFTPTNSVITSNLGTGIAINASMAVPFMTKNATVGLYAPIIKCNGWVYNTAIHVSPIMYWNYLPSSSYDTPNMPYSARLMYLP